MLIQDINNLALAEANEAYMEAVDFDKNYISLPMPNKIRRMPYGNIRKYFTKNGNKPYLFNGLTEVCKILTPLNYDSYALDAWKKEKGAAGDVVMYEAALLGTYMHVFCGQIAKAYMAGKTLMVSNSEAATFEQYLLGRGVRPFKISEFWRRVLKGAQSFNNFLVRHDVKILAIEYPVFSLDKMIATPLDIICEATIDGVRRVCNFNIKFRETAAAYESDALQICSEMYLYNAYIEAFKIDAPKIERTFILVPKSHPTARVECFIKEFTNIYTEQDFDDDILFLKQKPKFKGIFAPDLTAQTTKVENLQLGATVEATAGQTIADFILSFKD